ncbi:hypothetical protein EVAR_67780_1 [Eumeta japonica]|uniref:Uncharacterized protein n=1 Tax=Eumeta variegata TaxID=151549 RepID=A0A4C1ZX36_EUMVA|nr:hypothetical protein EVAR_67780_1 [Eumeta japonica]
MKKRILSAPMDRPGWEVDHTSYIRTGSAQAEAASLITIPRTKYVRRTGERLERGTGRGARGHRISLTQFTGPAGRLRL